MLGHADGICHVYVDENFGEVEKAIKIIVNSKLNYMAACNALECLIIHKSVLGEVLSALAKATEEANLKFHADEQSIHNVIGNGPWQRIQGLFQPQAAR